jgi:hypothetical protein
MTLGTEAFVQSFKAEGFGVVRSAIDPDTALSLSQCLTALLGPAPHPPPPQRLVPRIVERNERFAELAEARPLLQILDSVFGTAPRLICSYGHEKAAGTASHTGVHSDVAHLPGVPHHLSTLMVKVMYALTPVGPSDGATVVYPGTHRLPPEQTADATTAHQVQLDPGDLLLFHANIKHSATANIGTRARLGMWSVYALPWMRVFTGYEFDAAYLDERQARSTTEPRLADLYGLRDPYATVR